MRNATKRSAAIVFDNSNSSRRHTLGPMASLLALLGALIFAGGNAVAQSGTWIEPYDGAWNDGTNWQGGAIASGANNTADFSTQDLDAAVTFTNTGFYRNGIDIGGARTIGNMAFADSNTATPGGYEVYFGGTAAFNTDLTLAGTSPTITVDPLGPVNTGDLGAETPEVIDDVVIRAYLAGSNGFTKLGAGVLTLDGQPNVDVGAGNKISGVVNIAEGTLRIGTNFGYYDAFDLVDPQGQSITSFNLQDGATLDVRGLVGVNTVTVPADASVTIRGTNGAFVNNVTPAEGTNTLNIIVDNRITDTSETLSAHGNWSGFETVNISGNTTGVLDNFRMRPNGGGFDTGSFSNSVVNLDNIRLFVRSNSFGNDVVIPELHGTASSEISGGSNPGGVARWFIGGNNNNSEHAGAITSDSGGLDLIKDGTGTLTLSGPLTYSPVLPIFNEGNMAYEGQSFNPDRRGGITTVNAGTLALVGDASLPAGVDDVGTATSLGLLYTTVDIRAGATLDVSGASSTYSTAALQQVIGVGTIAGNYNHDEGRIAPGDDNVGNSATLVRTPGLLTFANDLAFNGGEILYDMDATPAGTNDLIQVNGSLNLGTGALVTPNFLNGIPTSGTYTIASSTTGISGSLAGWEVAWPGRGGNLPVSISGNDLVFTASAPTGGADLQWSGSVNADWNINTTANFHNTGTNSADVFYDADEVTFGDTYGGGTPVTNFNVNLAQDVQPLTITVDSTSDYSFGGPGAIIGFASLVKRGSSTLTMNTNNTFVGGVSIEAGTVDIVGNGGALGTGQLTMSGGTLRASNAGTTFMTNSSLNIAAATSNTIVANGTPSNPATNPLQLPGLTGSGNVRLATEEAAVEIEGNLLGRLVDLGTANSQFTGTLTIGPDTGAGATLIGARFSGDAASGIPNGSLVLEAGVTLNQRTNNEQTVQIGSLTGAAGSVLSGFAGGGTALNKTWEIGNLNTNTVFAGNVTDGGAATYLTKVGTGTLELTGLISYTGDTSVEGGILSLTDPNLADTSTVFIDGDAMFNLDFAGNDTINFLYLDGVPQAPTIYTAANSGGLITGSGGLNVLALGPPLEDNLPGDYNNDGFVNMADYTVWRDNVGAGAGTLGDNDTVGGTIGPGQYTLWKTNLGNMAGASAARQFGAASVPEPSSVVGIILLLGLGGLLSRRPCRT